MPADTRAVASPVGVATTRVGARPTRWVGAPAPGGLTLPSALPTASQLYGPRGVWLDEQRLVVADTGNHRVLIWSDGPSSDHAAADIVLGQADFTEDGAEAGGRGPERGMRLPTGVIVHDGQLIVADAWNHRLLIWDEIPARSDVAADRVVGQPDTSSTDENRGGPCGPRGFYWPFGLAVVGGNLHVADTGNRRVLIFDGVPEPDQLPAVVLGQDDDVGRDENRGAVGPASFRWPHDIAASDDVLFVADAGNHRILGWEPLPDGDRPASFVLGQDDFVTAREFPYAPQTASALRFPYAIDITAVADGDRMAVADTANNRVLIWNQVPRGSATPADDVLGQPDFAASGENRWQAVVADTFCWPYGLSFHGDRLAVADSGNNRVMTWEFGS